MNGHCFLWICAFCPLVSSLYVYRKLGSEPDYFVNDKVSQFNCFEYCAVKNGHEVYIVYDAEEKFVCSCQCLLRFPIFSSLTDNCTEPRKGCQFSFTEDRRNIPVLFLNNSGLVSTEVTLGIDYCYNLESFDCSPIHDCQILQTFYENIGWRSLQESKSSNFVITEEQNLKWIGNSCLNDLYTGLLVKISLKCVVAKRLIESCLLFRTNGTFSYASSSNSTPKAITCLERTTVNPHFSLDSYTDVTSSTPLSTSKASTKTWTKMSQVSTVMPTVVGSTKGTSTYAFISTSTLLPKTTSSVKLVNEPVRITHGNNEMIMKIASVVLCIVFTMVIVLIVFIIRRKRRVYKAKKAVQADLEECRRREIMNQRIRQEEILRAMEMLSIQRDTESVDNDNLSSSGYTSCPSSYGYTQGPFGHSMERSVSSFAIPQRKSPTLSLHSLQANRKENTGQQVASKVYSSYDRPDKLYVDKLREEFLASLSNRSSPKSQRGSEARRWSHRGSLGFDNKSYEEQV